MFTLLGKIINSSWHFSPPKLLLSPNWRNNGKDQTKQARRWGFSEIMDDDCSVNLFVPAHWFGNKPQMLSSTSWPYTREQAELVSICCWPAQGGSQKNEQAKFCEGLHLTTCCKSSSLFLCTVILLSASYLFFCLRHLVVSSLLSCILHLFFRSCT